MKDGVIANFTVTEQMLKSFIKKVHTPSIFTPRPASLFVFPTVRLRLSAAPLKKVQKPPALNRFI